MEPSWRKALAICVALALLNVGAGAGTLTIEVGPPGGSRVQDAPGCGAGGGAPACATLRYAVEVRAPAVAASAAGVGAQPRVVVAPGTYYEHNITAACSVAIEGSPGGGSVVVDASGNGRVLQADCQRAGEEWDISLARLHLRSGATYANGGGGCAFLNGCRHVHFSEVELVNGTAGSLIGAPMAPGFQILHGGALVVNVGWAASSSTRPSLLMENCVLANSTADRAGCLLIDASGNGSVTVVGTRVVGGYSDTHSGGVSAVCMDNANMRWVNSTVSECQTGLEGGGASMTAGGHATLEVSGSTFSDNSAFWPPSPGDLLSSDGGGMKLQTFEWGSVSIVDTAFIDNNAAAFCFPPPCVPDAGTGGGIDVWMSDQSTVSMVGGLFRGNSATGIGGGGLYAEVDLAASLELVGGTFTQNAAPDGGGGAVYISGGLEASGSLSWRGGEVVGNTAAQGGGGVLFDLHGGIAVTWSGGTVRDNTGGGQPGGGVSLYVVDNATVDISSMLVADNVAESSGGGGGISILCRSAATGGRCVTLSNVTMEGNRASGSGSAGGGALVVATRGNEVLPLDIERDWCPLALQQRHNPPPSMPPVPRMFAYSAHIAFNGVVLRNNSAPSGGGVALSGGNTTFTDCSVEGNTLVGDAHTTSAGLRASGAGTEVNLVRSRVADNDVDVSAQASVSLVGGTRIVGEYSSGALAAAEGSPIAVTGGAATREHDAVRLSCREGSTMSASLSRSISLQPPLAWLEADSSALCGALSHSLRVSCAPCPRGLYSMDVAEVEGAGGNLSVLSAVACLPCPLGGVCSGGAAVGALPGFWGQRVVATRTVVQFARCPLGYCCGAGTEGVGSGGPQYSCDAYDACFGNRAGPLCGACAPGYSAAVDSRACRPSGACGGADAVEFGALVAGMSTAFALYLLFVGGRKAAAHRREEAWEDDPYSVEGVRAYLAVEGDSDGDSGEAWRRWLPPPGLVSCTLYYGQMVRAAAPLAFPAAMTFALGITDMTVLRGNGGGASGLCPLPGLTTFHVLLLGFAVPVCVSVPLAGVHCCVCARRGHRSRRSARRASSQLSLEAPLVRETSQVELAPPRRGGGSERPPLGRRRSNSDAASEAFDDGGRNKAADDGASMAAAWTQLFSIASSRVLRTCFRLLRCVTLPDGSEVLFFVGSIACAAPWRPFVGAGVAAALTLPACLLLASTCKRASTPRWMALALRSLQAPYRSGLQWWWALALAHRVSLVAVQTFSGDDEPSVAAALVTLINVASLAAHASCRPFRAGATNAAQTVLLALLVQVGADSGEGADLRTASPAGSLSTVSQSLYGEWASVRDAAAAVAVALPLACTGAWVAAASARWAAFRVRSCCRRA